MRVSQEDLIIEHNGKPTLVLSKDMLNKQKCWENLAKIKAVHKAILELADRMDVEEDPNILKHHDRTWTELEFLLQEYWKFDRDSNFHRFWERPQCKCPRMDNEDRYPSGYYVKSQECPLHGEGENSE